MANYPRYIAMNTGEDGVITRGHGFSEEYLKSEIRKVYPHYEDEPFEAEELYLNYMPRVKWCDRYSDPCDSMGEWHGHWCALQKNDNANTYFTVMLLEF